MSGMLLAKNRKALFNHQLVEKYVAGMVLEGHEVKVLREKKVGFDGAYIQLVKNIPYIFNLHIAEYSKQGKHSIAEDTRKPRKLLLNKNEIFEINRELSQKGRTAVPLAVVLVNNLIKLEFAVVKGKKEFEKKETAKERQIKKDLERDFKDFRRGSEV